MVNDIKGGAGIGFVSGIVMAFIGMVYAYGSGLGFWLPMRAIGGLFMGVDALYGGAGAILLGILIHLIVATLLGIIFALFVQRETSSGLALVEGLVFGMIVWGVMTYVILPVMDPVLESRVALMPGFWFFMHLIFGSFLALTPAFQRELNLSPRPV